MLGVVYANRPSRMLFFAARCSDRVPHEFGVSARLIEIKKIESDKMKVNYCLQTVLLVCLRGYI